MGANHVVGHVGSVRLLSISWMAGSISTTQPAIKPFWDISEAEAMACISATRFYPASVEYFRGGGFSTCFNTLPGMPVTMSRVNYVDGLGPVLQLAEGWVVEIDPAIHEMLKDIKNKY